MLIRMQLPVLVAAVFSFSSCATVHRELREPSSTHGELSITVFPSHLSVAGSVPSVNGIRRIENKVKFESLNVSREFRLSDLLGESLQFAAPFQISIVLPTDLDIYIETGEVVLRQVKNNKKKVLVSIPQGSRNQAIVVGPLDTGTSSIGDTELSFYIDRTIPGIDPARIKADLMRLFQFYLELFGPAPVKKKSVLFLRSARNMDEENQIRLGIQSAEEYSRDFPYLSAHEMAHIWWNKDIPVDWIYEGIPEYVSYLANKELLGRDDPHFFFQEILGLRAEVQVRQHTCPMASLECQSDFRNGVHYEAYASQYYFAPLALEILRRRCPNFSLSSVFRTLNDRSRIQITTELFLKAVRQQCSTGAKFLEKSLAASPALLLSESRRIFSGADSWPPRISTVLNKPHGARLSAADMEIVEDFLRNTNVDYKVYKNVASLLAADRNQELELPITRVLKETSDFRRRWALAMMLGRIASPGAFATLRAEFGADLSTQMAAYGEGKTDPDVIRVLLKTIQDQGLNPNDRITATASLSRISENSIPLKAAQEIFDFPGGRGQYAILNLANKENERSLCSLDLTNLTLNASLQMKAKRLRTRCRRAK